jgi:hypothetical protein
LCAPEATRVPETRASKLGEVVSGNRYGDHSGVVGPVEVVSNELSSEEDSELSIVTKDKE